MSTPLSNQSAQWANVNLDPETERGAALATIELLKAVQAEAQKAIDEQSALTLHRQFAFADFDPRYLEFILATVGTGEVRINIDQGRVKLEETAIPALWHVQDEGVHSFILALIPPTVLEAADRNTHEFAVPETTPEGVFAAPAILTELQAALEKTDITQLSFDPAYMIELTRQPLAPADREYLQSVMGTGNMEILLSGFAQAHIKNTTVRGIWNSQLLNNAGKDLLDSYVVARIPPEVPSDADELENTVRLTAETLRWLHEDLERGALG